MNRMINAGLVAALTALVSYQAAAQTFADQIIPYQGRLEKDGSPEDGKFDFYFYIFDSATDGSEAWSDEFLGVDVSAGSFAVGLGSGSVPLSDTMWQTNDLFVEIHVRRNNSPSELNYVPLNNRQKILRLPFAAKADTASDFLVAGELLVYDSVHIFAATTSTVAADLEVQGAVLANTLAMTDAAFVDESLSGTSEAYIVNMPAQTPGDGTGALTLVGRKHDQGVVPDPLDTRRFVDVWDNLRVHGQLDFTSSRHIYAQTLPGDGPFGNYRGWKICQAGYYVCGLNQKVEGSQGGGDDTGMNAVRMLCCSLGQPENPTLPASEGGSASDYGSDPFPP